MCRFCRLLLCCQLVASLIRSYLPFATSFSSHTDLAHLRIFSRTLGEIFDLEGGGAVGEGEGEGLASFSTIGSSCFLTIVSSFFSSSTVGSEAGSTDGSSFARSSFAGCDERSELRKELG